MPFKQPSPEQEFEEVRTKLRKGLEACQAMAADYRAIFSRPDHCTAIEHRDSFDSSVKGRG
jgi:hypothetical protein